MTFDRWRALRRKNRRERSEVCAAEGTTEVATSEQREDSAKAIHATTVEMVLRMAEALEAKNAKAREAFSRASHRPKHS